jgi:phenylalanyl-tRNA synthetase beta chain
LERTWNGSGLFQQQRSSGSLPVIQLSLSRLVQYCSNKADQTEILKTIPYLGLDIEDHDGDTVNVEYSPNRPDFSSEVGIARSLVGIMGLEVGAPTYQFIPSKYKVRVLEDQVSQVRPRIQALYSEIQVTEDLIRQLIGMQEDLHNGIGRRRAKVAIGIHNASSITEQVTYRATKDRSFSFPPLGSNEKKTIDEILGGTDQGLIYGKLLYDTFPLLEDSRGNVLSMPPIINGNVTRVAAGQSRLFVDVTGTDERSVDVSTAIIASMLADSGAKVYSVEIVRNQGSTLTPDATPRSMRLDLELATSTLGFEISEREAEVFLGRSRIGMYSNGNAVVPRYRFDIIHPIDLVEEIALGYGIQRIKPQEVKSSLIGEFSRRQKKLDRIVEALVGLELTEVWNLSLTGPGEADEESLKVEDSKSQNFEFLRTRLSMSLLTVLSGSTHQEYPQRIFEQAPVFKHSRTGITSISEEENVGIMVADSRVDYSMIRSIVDAFLGEVLNQGTMISYRPPEKALEPFLQGRSALISIARADGERQDMGVIGEVAPRFLEKFGMKVPVAGAEIGLEGLLKG